MAVDELIKEADPENSNFPPKPRIGGEEEEGEGPVEAAPLDSAEEGGNPQAEGGASSNDEEDQ